MYLNCHSYFSFKYGTMSLEDLLREAVSKGVVTIALTDINNTSGILEFFRTAGDHGIKPVAGIDFRNGNEQVFIGLAKNIDGFAEMNSFLSEHLHTGKRVPEMPPSFEHAAVIYPFAKAPAILRENEYIGIKPAELFKLNFYDWRKISDKMVALLP